MKSTRRLLYSAAIGTGLIFCGGTQAEHWKVTGEFGITGDNTFVGVTQVNWADGTSSGYATWNR